MTKAQRPCWWTEKKKVVEANEQSFVSYTSVTSGENVLYVFRVKYSSTLSRIGLRPKYSFISIYGYATKIFALFCQNDAKIIGRSKLNSLREKRHHFQRFFNGMGKEMENLS